MSYTPGPWRLSQGNIGNAIEADSGRQLYEGDTGFRTVAMFQACTSAERFTDQEANRLANGMLIAAAPELLEALQSCAGVLSHHGIASATLQRALAAIAKATGAEA